MQESYLNFIMIINRSIFLSYIKFSQSNKYSKRRNQHLIGHEQSRSKCKARVHRPPSRPHPKAFVNPLFG